MTFTKSRVVQISLSPRLSSHDPLLPRRSPRPMTDPSARMGRCQLFFHRSYHAAPSHPTSTLGRRRRPRSTGSSDDDTEPTSSAAPATVSSQTKRALEPQATVRTAPSAMATPGEFFRFTFRSPQSRYVAVVGDDCGVSVLDWNAAAKGGHAGDMAQGNAWGDRPRSVPAAYVSLGSPAIDASFAPVNTAQGSAADSHFSAVLATCARGVPLQIWGLSSAMFSDQDPRGVGGAEGCHWDAGRLQGLSLSDIDEEEGGSRTDTPRRLASFVHRDAMDQHAHPFSAAWGDGGQTIAAGYDDGEVEVFDVHVGALPAASSACSPSGGLAPSPLVATNGITAFRLNAAAESSHSLGGGGSVFVGKGSGGKAYHRHVVNRQVTALATQASSAMDDTANGGTACGGGLSPSVLVAGLRSGHVQLLDLRMGCTAGVVLQPKDHGRAAFQVAFTPADQPGVIVGTRGAGQPVHVFDLRKIGGGGLCSGDITLGSSPPPGWIGSVTRSRIPADIMMPARFCLAGRPGGGGGGPTVYFATMTDVVMCVALRDVVGVTRDDDEGCGAAIGNKDGGKAAGFAHKQHDGGRCRRVLTIRNGKDEEGHHYAPNREGGGRLDDHGQSPPPCPWSPSSATTSVAVLLQPEDNAMAVAVTAGIRAHTGSCIRARGGAAACEDHDGGTGSVRFPIDSRPTRSSTFVIASSY